MNSLNLAPIQSILLWDTKERSIFLNTYPTISLNFQGKPAAHEWKHSSQRAARGACVCDSGVSRHQQWQIWSWVNGISPHENLRLPRGEPQDERNINLHLGLSCNSLSEAELPWAGSIRVEGADSSGTTTSLCSSKVRAAGSTLWGYRCSGRAR